MTMLTELDHYNDRFEAVARRMMGTVQGLIGPQPEPDASVAYRDTSHVQGQLARLHDVLSALESLALVIDRQVCAPEEEACLMPDMDRRFVGSTLVGQRRPIRDSPQA